MPLKTRFRDAHRPISFLTAHMHPSGCPYQRVVVGSNVNYRAGVDIANAVIVKFGAGAKACTFAVKHLLVDVNV